MKQAVNSIKMVPLMIIMACFSIEILSLNKVFAVCLNFSKMMDIWSTFVLNSLSLTFVAMVSIVSIFIMIYSALYMESYNKKKFLTLTMLFFASMLILSVSDGMLMTMLGWDGLGVSSICLIMMYQSKKTSSNALLTMTFNRIGDVFLMMGSIKVASEYCDFSISLSPENTNCWGILMLAIASMTKSAQFPLSAWLPAAMSAPTPISAMVHSSTLVTAGVYLIYKTSKVMETLGILWILSIISSVSMISAGVYALYEKDLKKIIAFSTMSHISVMILMISLNLKTLAVIHMFTHALFKTSVFMSAGVTFLLKWSSQNLEYNNMNSKTNMSFFKASTLMLTSMPFTSSFYTKDLFMEMNLFEEKSESYFCVMMWCLVVLTILYSKKIMEVLVEKSNTMKISYEKKSLGSVFFFMALSMLYTSKMTSLVWKNLMFPMVSLMEMLFSLAMIMIATQLKVGKKKIMMLLSNSMAGKTEFSISKLSSLVTKWSSVSEIDQVLSSSDLWLIKNSNLEKFSQKSKTAICAIMIACAIVMFS